jgi:hypothetical protein
MRVVDVKILQSLVCAGIWFAAGLPDGLFSNQKSKFGSIFEGPAIKDVGILYGLLEYFTYEHLGILCPFVHLC